MKIRALLLITLLLGFQLAFAQSRPRTQRTLATPPPAPAAPVNPLRPLSPDEELAKRVEDRLISVGDLPVQAVNVNVANGVVTLSGTLQNQLELQRVLATVKDLPGVPQVVNTMKVEATGRPDQDIRQEVQQGIASDPALNADGIKVAVDHGVVTLRGSVRIWQEKDIAQWKVENVKGVRDIQNQLTIEPAS